MYEYEIYHLLKCPWALPTAPKHSNNGIAHSLQPPKVVQKEVGILDQLIPSVLWWTNLVDEGSDIASVRRPVV
jgi:hypothetical protein